MLVYDAYAYFKHRILTDTSISHPLFPKLIEKFQHEQKNAEILIEKMCAGKRVSRYKKPLYVKLDKNLSELVAAYDPSKLLVS